MPAKTVRETKTGRMSTPESHGEAIGREEADSLERQGEEQTTEGLVASQAADLDSGKPEAPPEAGAFTTHPEPATDDKRLFPVVGIGASAGGLEALEEFFQDLPRHSGMAYVVISHTDPARSSLLPEIIRRRINIPVIQVEDGMNVEPDTIYLPPSNRDLALDGDIFRLKEQKRGTTLHLPIDTFFKSLAHSRGEQACCVILSGMGTDGTQGLRIIKEKGGVTVVQSTESAKYEGMPESAIGTGLADFVLRPSEMPERLIEFFTLGIDLPKPEEAEAQEEFPATLSKIITTISNRLGHDFSAYKKSTLIRRIQRRMTVTRVTAPHRYLNYLHHNPGEIESLFQDLLIGVTSFFRDPEAYDCLRKKILPDIIRGRTEHETLRIWAAGCATGEEVYSIVMLVMECLDEMGIRKEIQAFGTDLDQRAIEKARDGLYPENIIADLSPARLKRFFDKENSRFRVRKEVRDPVVFAAHNVLKDPPFSKLDLLVCRNLLIYLEPKAQKKVLPLFHYALRPGGILFLGSSETVGEFTDLFTPILKKWSIYRKIDVSPALKPIVEFPTGGRVATTAVERALTNQAPPGTTDSAVAEATARLLLEAHTPACVVVNHRGEINYIHGRTGKYLEPAPGRMSVNIIDMAREGLRFELASALRKVTSTGEAIRKEGLRVKTNGEYQDFNLVAKPMGRSESLKNMIVILFEAIPASRKRKTPQDKSGGMPDAVTQRTIELEREIARLQQDHRIAMEELETSNEELKSVNEELQSSNEELQSTNEELESSREELQSLNEEMSTVNAELHDKIVELSHSFETINHLLNSTRIAILFVDRDLRLLRFTKEATKLINLIEADIGRSLTHISTNLDRDSFLDDIRKAITEQQVVEMEICTKDSYWYAAKIVPYQSPQKQAGGAVITFINIDLLIEARMHLSEQKLEQ